MQRSVSTDQGDTWSITVDTDIANPGASLEVIALRDGSWVMVFNDVEGGRHQLSLARSEDEGIHWKWKRRLEIDSEMETSYSYPSLIQSRDGRLHLTYSHSGPAGEAIKHVAVSADWILEDGRP